MSRPRSHRWLAVLPPLAVVVGVPLVNGSQVHVAGLPALLAWMLGCVLFTPLVMGLVLALDRRHDARYGAEEPPGEDAP
jgi:hypothetical protein